MLIVSISVPACGEELLLLISLIELLMMFVLHILLSRSGLFGGGLKRFNRNEIMLSFSAFINGYHGLKTLHMTHLS